ncbi:MAG: ribonuclease III [Bacteroidetes bacterium]|nr:ribonuclease III [Bacteroidota bacterium]
MFSFFHLFKKKDERLLRLKSLIGFYPRNEQLFRTALRHSSVIYTQKVDLESNERLEFLGDAVLELVISEMLYEKYPDKNEGQLTKLRIKLVNRNYLNTKAIEIGMPSLLHQYVGKKKQLKIDNHSIFGNALEAIIGAIYIEKGYAFAKRFVEEKVIGNVQQMEALLQTKVDFKSQLLSWGQKTNTTIEFVEMASDSPDSFKISVKVNEKFYGVGAGKRKKNAHQQAAELTVKQLEKELKW